MIDALLVVMYLAVGVAAALTVWSVVRTFRMRDRAQGRQNHIAAGRIAWASAGLLVAALAATFALGSPEPLAVGGVSYDSRFWLRVADMFINSSLILMLVAAGCVAFGMSGVMRRSDTRRQTAASKQPQADAEQT